MDENKDADEKGEKEDEKDNQMLRSAVHYTVYKISQECAQGFRVQFSKEPIMAIADHVFRNMEQMGRDLELFAKHAKRKTINPDDVKLLFRNCPELGLHIDSVLKKFEEEKSATLTKKKDPPKKSPLKTNVATPFFDVERQNEKRSKSVSSDEVEECMVEEKDERMDFENDFDI